MGGNSKSGRRHLSCWSWYDPLKVLLYIIMQLVHSLTICLQLTSIRTILFNHYYTIQLVNESAPTMFTVRTLDLVCDYLFHEVLELVDINWVQEAYKEGCRQIHVMPRFTRPLPGIVN